MTTARRLICAGTGGLAAAATLALRAAAEGRMAQTAGDAVALLAAAALAGALILPGRVWPAARGWLRPLVGGVLLAPAALALALLPDVVVRVAGGADPVGTAALLLLSAVYALAIAGPVCVAAALALHVALRFSSPS